MKIILVVMSSAHSAIDTFASTNVQQDLKFGWMLENNCGPRPNGPKYPAPPEEGNGIPHDVIGCDIIRDSQYIAGYRCEAPCQMNPEMSVTLYCNCHTQIGPLQFIKDCEWEWVDGARCPTVPENEIHYDWECNPKWSVCPGGQYEKPEMLYDYLLPDYIAEVTTTTTTGMVTTTTTEEPTTTTIPTTTTKRAKKHKHTQARFQTADGHKINKVREHRTDSRIQQKMDLDDIKTRYYIDGDEAGDMGDLADVNTKVEKGSNPSITNIIDFRPLFTRLFDGSPKLEQFDPISTIRKQARSSRADKKERSTRIADYGSDMLDYADFGNAFPLSYKSGSVAVINQTDVFDDMSRDISRDNVQARKGGRHWAKKHVAELKEQNKDKLIQSGGAMHLQQKLARMIAVRNTLKHEKKSLEHKIETIMEFVSKSASNNDKMKLYKQLSDMDKNH